MVPTIFVDTHGGGSDVCGHIEVRQPQVLGRGENPKLKRVENLREEAAGQVWGGHTSICLSWKTRWILRLKAEPVNMEVTGYVRSNTGSSTEVML